MSDLDKCPKCGGPADNGNDRCVPPSAYVCTRCEEISRLKQAIKDVKAIYRNDHVPAAFENRMNELFELVEE